MSSLQKFGALAVACLFAAALAAPVDAQHRQKSGSSVSSGAKAAPRGGGGGQSAGPRSSPQGSGQSAGARQPQGPRPSPGAGPAARPRPEGAPVTGRAMPRPENRPGAGYPGYYPGYGSRGHYPYYGYRGYYPYYGYRGYYYGYYPGWYWGFGAYFGPYYYSPWFYGAYWSYPTYYYPYDYVAGGASLKVNVEPKTAEVFIDGYLAGIVDQFDGMFQSLSVEPGEHEVTVYQPGYRSIVQRLYMSPGATLRIKGVLEKLAPGEPEEARPQPAYRPQADAQVEPPQQYRSPEPQAPPPVSAPVERPATESYPPPGDGRYGQVAIRVQPADAEVFIDGEPWRTQAGVERLLVQLSAGTHRVEIRKEGYDAFVTAVEIRRGETAVLNVSLSRF